MSPSPLLRALREPFNPAGVRAALLDVDLDAVLDRASRHGLAGALQHAVSVAEVPLPGSTVSKLRQVVTVAGAQALRSKHLLLRLNQALRAEGVRPVLLKGYGLGARLYAEPLLRPTSDVDLLVGPDELSTSRSVLRELGLEPKVDSDDFYPPQYRHHEAFAGPAGLVELHFRLMANWGAVWEGSEALARTVDASLDGAPVRYLGPEDELVYLALHAANHMLARLGWVYDLARFVSAYTTLDWDLVVTIARATRMPAPAFYALDAATRLFGAAVPGSVLAALAPHRPAVAAARALFTERWLLDGSLDGHRTLRAAAKVLLADNPSHVALFAARRLRWDTIAALRRLARGAPYRV